MTKHTIANATSIVLMTLASVHAALPDSPVNLTAAVMGSTVTVSWLAPATPVTSYMIEAGFSPGAANLAAFSTGSTATQFSAAGVAPGTYYVRVRAINQDGVSAASNEVRVDVMGFCFLPTMPSGLTDSVSGSMVALRWIESVGAVTYIVEAGSAPRLANIATIDLRSNVPTLTASAGPGTYYVRVRARNSCGLSPPTAKL